MTKKVIGVIGAGAWGTALAINCAKVCDQVYLWTKEEELVQSLKSEKENKQYLAGCNFPENIVPTNHVSGLKDCDLYVWVVPTQFTPDVLPQFAEVLQGKPVVIASKGILLNRNENFLTEHFSKVLDPKDIFSLSGPNFAIEVGKNLPAATVIAGEDKEKTLKVSSYFKNKNFRVYISSDRIGLEIAGASKNVYAIGAGIIYGLKLGQNTIAAYTARALAEIFRIGEFWGAQQQTFMGLAGMGDLVLTCYSQMSRNTSLGTELALGKTLDEIIKSRTTVAEGVYTAKALYDLSLKHNLRMPLCHQIYKVLYEDLSVSQAIEELLGNQSPEEF